MGWDVWCDLALERGCARGVGRALAFGEVGEFPLELIGSRHTPLGQQVQILRGHRLVAEFVQYTPF